ncbi:MAG: Ig-like domain-containing protein, partial [Pseudomonas sp.]|uniref:Ig-like domain-containing protein n=1 Tax=Pseudomonas sp. TaxID=306 RepID=UPI003392F4C2
SFTYSLTDANGDVSTATVTVNVTPVNDLPVAVADTVQATEDQVLNGSLATNDTPSADGGNVWALGTQASNGVVTVNADGTFTYTPNANYNGADSFTYSLTDANGDVSTATVTVNVTPVNDLPVAVADTVQATEDQVLNGNLAGNDTPSADGGNVWALGTQASNGIVVVNADGTFTYTPNANYNGADSFTYSLTDANGDVSTATVTVNVAPVNDAPALQPSQITVNEDELASGNLLSSATDVDGSDTLSVVNFTIGGNTHTAGTPVVIAGVGTLNVGNDGQYSFEPTANWSGSLPTVTFTVSDGTTTQQSSLNIAVTPVADAPTLDLDNPLATPTPTGLVLQTWNNLPLGTGGNGADPATLQSTIDQAGAPATTGQTSDASNTNVNAGTASKLSGLIHLEAGQTYTFSGGGDDSIRVVVGGTVVGQGTWGGSSGTFNGTFSPTTSGYYTLEIYHHNQAGPGNYDVNLSVNGAAAQNLSTVASEIYRSLSDLSADGVRLSALHGSNGRGYYNEYVQNEGDEDTAIPLSAIDSALTDIDGSESLAVSIGNIPVGAKLSDGVHQFTASATQNRADVTDWDLGKLTITPPLDFTGQFALQITATSTESANSLSADTSLPLTVVVHPVIVPPVQTNNNPVTTNDSVTTAEDSPLSLPAATLLANDSDPDGNPLTISSVQGASHGSVVLLNGNVVFTPDANYNGPASFTYTVIDGQGGSSTATVNVNVTPVNDLPVAVADTVQATEDQVLNGTLATNDTPSADGGNVWSLSTQASNGTVVVNANGTFTYTPNANYNGADSFTYRLTDANGDISTATVTVNVAAVNDLPVAVADTVQATEDRVLNGTLATNDTPSADGGNIWSLGTQASNGTVVVNVNGTFTYTPNANYNGADSFTYRLTDANGDISTATVTVNVAAVNDQPVAVADTVQATEDQVLNGNLAGNDTPSGDGGNVWSLGTQASNGTVVVNANGTFTYTPNANYNGVDSFTYRLTDTNGDISTATVNLTVNPQNDAPAAANGAASGNEDTPLLLNWSQFNASDVDTIASALSIRITTLPADGRVQFNNGSAWVDVSVNQLIGKADIDGGKLRFLPDAGESGGDAFTAAGVGDQRVDYAQLGYQVSDGSLNSGSATLTLDIAPRVDIPSLSVSNGTRSVFTTSWETATNSDTSSQSVSGSSFEGWTLITSPDSAPGGTNSFEVWANADTQANSAGNFVTVNMAPGNGNNALELNNATNSLAQTLGIERSLTTEAGKVYDLSLDYAGRPGFTSGFTSIAVLVDGVQVATYASTSPDSGLSWQNLHFSFTGTGATQNIRIVTNATSIDASGRGALIDDIRLTQYQGAIAGNAAGGTQTQIALAAYVLAALGDSDGSEKLTLTFGNLPSGANIVTASHPSGYSVANGTVTLDAADLASAKLQVAASYSGPLSLTVAAHATEANGQTSDSVSQQLDLQILPRNVDVAAISTGPTTGSNHQTLTGTAGADEIHGLDGRDTISGGGGNDQLYGGTGNDVLNGEGGNDSLYGDEGTDTLNGGVGNDLLDGGSDNDVLFGNEGDDRLLGNLGNDQLTGGSGHDQLDGGAGVDLLFGDDGDDRLIGGLGNDQLTGGAGHDSFIWQAGHAQSGQDVIKDFNLSQDRIDLRDLLQGENDGNILNFLRVNTATSTLEVSSSGGFSGGNGTADLTIKLESGGNPVDLSAYGANSSQIVNSLIAGADPVVKVDH